MKCPYCQTEMVSGFLTDLGFDGYGPRWKSKQGNSGKSNDFKRKHTVSKLHRLFEIEADYCRVCEKFIFDGKAMEEY